MAGLKSVSDAVKKIWGRVSGGATQEAAKEPAKNWAAKRLEKEQDLAALGINKPQLPDDAGALDKVAHQGKKIAYEGNFDLSERSPSANRFRKIVGTAVIAGATYGGVAGVTSGWKDVGDDPGSLGDGYTLNSHLLVDKVEGIFVGIGNALPGKESKNSPTSLVSSFRMSSCIERFGKDECYARLEKSRARHPSMAEEFSEAKEADIKNKIKIEHDIQAKPIAKAENAASAAAASADESAKLVEKQTQDARNRYLNESLDVLSRKPAPSQP